MLEFKYPYTDTSVLNLDWFLEQFKELLESWDAQKVDYEQFKEDLTTEFNTLSGKFDDLDEAFQALKSYVENYFENLDVQQEINNKLDEMVEDGTLKALLQPMFDEVVADQNGRISVLEGRMDEFTNLPEGSTTGDAELMDIRVGFDGSTYPTAGDAVRDQCDYLNDFISNIEIEGYTKSDGKPVDLSSYKVASKFVYSNNGTLTEVSSSSYEYYDVPINDEIKAAVRGFTGTSIKVCLFVDNDNHVLAYYPTAFVPSPGGYQDVIATVPAGATRILINTYANGQKSLTWLGYQNYHKSPPVLGSTTDNEEYLVIGPDLVWDVILHGSQNGAFNYKTLNTAGGVTFKGVVDDISPFYIAAVGYVGANHGYYLVYNCKCTAHGLTAANIGEKDSNNFVLIKITDTDNIVVGHYVSNVWYRLSAVVPAEVTFGGNTITVETATQVQLYPSVKNVSVSVVENTAERFVVAESYDIFDIGVGLDALIANVGNNDNDSIRDLSDPLITVRNLYIFAKDSGVCTVQNILTHKTVNISTYAGIQSMKFGATDFYSVPNTTLKTLQTSTVTTSFLRNTWDTNDKPPKVYCQFDNDRSTFTKCMMFVFLTENDRNTLLNTTAGYINGPTQKLYPYFFEPGGNVAAYTEYSGLAIKIPIACSISDVAVSGYAVRNNEVYVGIVARGTGYYKVDLPAVAMGKKVEVVSKDGAECISGDAANSVDIISSENISYIVLKLS